VPRVVLIFLAATATFAVLWWFLMPAWPLGSTYTKGLLGIDQREIVTDQLREATAERATWMTQIESSSYDDIQADPKLMRIVEETGSRLYGDNCAACHGVDAKGAANYPDLTDGAASRRRSPKLCALASTRRMTTAGSPRCRRSDAIRYWNAHRSTMSRPMFCR